MTDLTDAAPSYHLITDRKSLEAIIPELMHENVVAMDIEADSMYHFAEQVCLIQIATAKRCLLIDPLAVNDVSSLRPLFQEAGITKIFHGASYDVRCLALCYNMQINNLFDTEIACRFLGLSETGLNAVLQQTFDVALDKKYQKKDWSRRPLSDEMLTYAARDVLYLIPLWRLLKKQLKEKQRMAWVEEEFRIISTSRPADETGRPLFLKFKGAGRLDRRSLAVLEYLLKKRQDIARKKDLPLFKIFNTQAMIRLAEEKPTSRKALMRSGILSEKQMDMYAESICQAIRKGLGLEEKDLPVYPREKRKPLSLKASLRINALKQWRETAAEKFGMDSGLLLSNAVAMSIARKNPQTIKQLDDVEEIKQWQKKALGREIIEVLNAIS